ncbi:polysaccharide pyruvyl transferase family protein [Methanogenium marinum]|uniref:Polysaccharide pyruvyl transferase family protein n=1 Tax=Methanogenium marinum TaxID=348610 RepID=A0A9Q4KU89_9EURY|nr:polysaccharide pyruvyl transferase family protein [Methanogenium marinum]MDE4907356.1 polysaccharide pyruvyl transferase family protein [Methanogenium marinum]
MMKSIKKNVSSYLLDAKNEIFNADAILAYWSDGDLNNWGDALNPILIHNISGKWPTLARPHINIKNKPVFRVVGSILDGCSDRNAVIWGSGFISASGKFMTEPRSICAVRGPLTRDLIIKQGIECPEVYGDPALLYPIFYCPNINKKYELGIVPHYIDKNSPLLKQFEGRSDVKIINIQGGINDFVDDICGCKRIASSSLHGIIASDAYGIPSTWVKLSENVVGNGFKFLDYFLSVGRLEREPLTISKKTTISDIYDSFNPYTINIDLNHLLEVCPFNKCSSQKNERKY